MKPMPDWIARTAVAWLTREGPPPPTPLCDFNRLRYELRPGDVVLIEGRSRVSDVIKMITQAPWTHSALYLGRLHDIGDEESRERVQEAHDGDASDQLVLEALLGQGTIVAPLNKYRHDHLRICRPVGLSPQDAQTVIAFCVERLGTDYDVRQLLDLARFFIPWTFLPRRWRSSLFEHHAGQPTRTVCSSLIAEAFNEIDFPILPFINRGTDGSLRFFKRNPRLFTPRDFDYSPYFEIIKYPFLGLDDIGIYRKLPWGGNSRVYNDEADGFLADERAAQEIDGASRGSRRESIIARISPIPLLRRKETLQ